MGDLDEFVALKRDQNDMFAAVNALGGELEEYDLEHDVILKRFKRGDDWKEGLNAIRKLLKKYYRHEDLPARGWLAEWRVLQSKLLPMVVRYPSDRDMLYNMGKVMVFMTSPPPAGAALVDRQHQAKRDYLAAIVKSANFLPAFLSLLEPALDASASGGLAPKSDADVNAVDLVVTLLKQLAETPNGNGGDMAGVLEALVTVYGRDAVMATLASLCRLCGRTEFKRLTVLLSEFVCVLFRGQTPEALVKAGRKAIAAAATTDCGAAVAAGGAGVSSGGGASSGGGRLAAPPSGPTTAAAAAAMMAAATASSAALVPITAAPARGPGKATARSDDPLAAHLSASLKQRALADSASTRHGRFGTMLVVNSMGSKKMMTSLPTSATAAAALAGGAGAIGSGAGAGGVASLAARRIHPVVKSGRGRSARKPKHEWELAAPPRIDTANGIGTLALDPTGMSVTHRATDSSIEQARAVLYATAQELLRGELNAAEKGALAAAAAARKAARAAAAAARKEALASVAYKGSEDEEEEEEGDGDGDDEGEGGEKKKKAADAGDGDEEGEGEEEDDEADATPESAFATLTTAMKNAFIRDSDELAPEDTLRYLHATGILLGVYRLSEVQRGKEAAAAAQAAWQEYAAAQQRQREQAKRDAAATAAKRRAGAAAATADAGSDDAAVAPAAPQVSTAGMSLLARKRMERLIAAPAGDHDDDEEGEGEKKGAAAAPTPPPPPATVTEPIVPAHIPLLLPGLSPEPVRGLFDRWSLGRLVQLCDTWIQQKHWDAVAVAIGHLKELLLFVHALVECGDAVAVVPAHVAAAAMKQRRGETVTLAPGSDTSYSLTPSDESAYAEAVAEASEGKEFGLLLMDQLWRDRDVVDLLPRLLREWERARYEKATLAALVEATHYTIKMAETAAQLGMLGDDTRDDDDDDDGGGRGSSGGKSRSRSKRKRPVYADLDAAGDGDPAAVREAYKARMREEAVSGYVVEFAHPAVVQAYTAALRGYAANGARQNYYTAAMLRRIETLPNDYADKHPATGKTITWRVLLYHVSVLEAVTALINDRAVAGGGGSGGAPGRRDCADLVDWAQHLSACFLRDAAANPLLFAEALFWRHDKSAHAEVARHYGVIDGNTATISADGDYQSSTDLVGGSSGGSRALSKAARERAEAAAAAQYNAAARASGEGDDEAEFDAEAEAERDAVAIMRRGGRGGGGGGAASASKPPRRKRKPTGKKAVARDEDSSGGGGSGDDSDGGGGGARSARKKGKGAKRAAASSSSSSSSSDSDDEGTSPRSGRLGDADSDRDRDDDPAARRRRVAAALAAAVEAKRRRVAAAEEQDAAAATQPLDAVTDDAAAAADAAGVDSDDSITRRAIASSTAAASKAGGRSGSGVASSSSDEDSDTDMRRAAASGGRVGTRTRAAAALSSDSEGDDAAFAAMPTQPLPSSQASAASGGTGGGRRKAAIIADDDDEDDDARGGSGGASVPAESDYSWSMSETVPAGADTQAVA